MGLPGVRLTNTKINENYEDADIQFRSLKALYDKYHPNFMFNMMDLSLEAESLGLKILKPDDAPYTIVEHPIKNEHDLGKLDIPHPKKNGRMPIASKVIRKMHKGFDCINVAYIIGPYTLAGLLCGASTVIKNVLKNVVFLEKVLEFSSKVIDIYCTELISSGADMICMLEPTATGLSPEQFKEFSGNYIKKLKSNWNIPLILHICGDTTSLICEMIKTNCKGISLDAMVDLQHAANLISSDILILGNIDPVRVLAFGNKEEVEEKVKKLLFDMRGVDNFILSSGCDIPLDTPLENIEAFMKAVRG
jgi:uroporphyrinogen decarboxylase